MTAPAAAPYDAPVPRLDALISRNLGLSRRQVARLMRAGRVCDQAGQRLDERGLPCRPSDGPQTVVIDDTTHVLYHRFELLLHKPVGVVTAHRDARHPTAYALLEGTPLHRDLRSVGRLDLDTSGLLLWTTDGTLVHRLTHPRYAVPREYHVGLARPFEDPTPQLRLDDGHAPGLVALQRCEEASMHPALRRSARAQQHASITLRTGRFHEVRRIFAALGSEVVDLCRVRYGDIVLPPALAAGEHDPIDLQARFAGLSPVPSKAPPSPPDQGTG
ncbi:MAG: 16S rRNA pseudouridine(516) synthase [Deltaproteobacteria bacterium]|nr:16S rRNA pseudouridine(516) synthase [Deltaproteobacteria bacterium]